MPLSLGVLYVAQTAVGGMCKSCDLCVCLYCSVVKGRMPQVGERVLVKAVYNSSHSVQWSALKVQVQPTQVQALVQCLGTMTGSLEYRIHLL